MREITLLDDTKLFIHDYGEALSDAIARDQDYFEREILDYLSGNHVQNEVILDIGANIGNHTAYFAQYLEYSQIIAFEPVLDNFILLRQNTRTFPNVSLRGDAAGAERKTVRMTLNRENMGACEIDPAGEEVVQQVRIDDLFIKKVTLMKIDVEWSEPDVLKGAKNIIAEDQPLILIEDSEAQYAELLYSLGYEIEAAWTEHKTYLYRSQNA